MGKGKIMKTLKKLSLIILYALFFNGIIYAQTAIQPQGSGTDTEPYLIANIENLYWVSQNSSSWDKHFLQTAHIDFNDVAHHANWDNNEGWQPIGQNGPGNQSPPFTGVYDGNGKLIKNLFINRGNENYVGLFGKIESQPGQSAQVKNLGLTNVDITAKEYVGGIAGHVKGVWNANTYIQNVFVTGHINGHKSVGGIVGYLDYMGKVRQAYFNGSMEAVPTKNAFGLGGIVGESWPGSGGGIDKVYANVEFFNIPSWFDPVMQTHYGGVVAHGDPLTVTNSFWNSDYINTSSGGSAETIQNMRNETLFINAGWDFVNDWIIYSNINDGLPILISTPPTGEMLVKEFTNNHGFYWNTPENWLPRGTPSHNFKVVIPNNLTSVINGTKIAEAGKLIVQSGASLTIEEDAELIINGNLLIEANAFGAASFIDKGTINVEGEMIFQEFVPDNTYGNTIASPVESAPRSLFDNHVNTFFYNPLIPGWEVYSAGDMEIMRGYWTKFDEDVVLAFKGQFNTGDIVYTDLFRTVAYGSGNHGWNFLGNPYPSAISWDAVAALDENTENGSFRTTTKLNAAVYISNNNGGYLSYIPGNPGIGQTGFEDGIIPPATAFWVQVNKDYGFQNTPVPDARLNFNNNVRVHRNAGANQKVAAAEVLRLSFDNGQHTDELVLRLLNDANASYNSTTDAIKMFSNNPAQPQIYAIAEQGEKTAIKGVPTQSNDSFSLPLGFVDKQDDILSISLGDITNNQSGITVYLEDLKLDVIHNFKDHNTYQFKSSDEENNNRFIIHIKKTTTGVHNSMTETNEPVIYTHDGNLFVNQDFDLSEVKVFNLLGQKLLSTDLTHAGLHRINLNLSSGQYIVTVSDAQNVFTQRIFIK